MMSLVENGKFVRIGRPGVRIQHIAPTSYNLFLANHGLLGNTDIQRQFSVWIFTNSFFIELLMKFLFQKASTGA